MGLERCKGAKFPCLPKKQKALVLLNNAVRRLVPGETQDKLRALAAEPDFQQSPAYAAFCESLCRDVLLDARRQLAFKSPSHARTLEKLVAHPETLYHESVLSPHGVYTFPLLFGLRVTDQGVWNALLVVLRLIRRTPSLEDLSVVQQYFDKFLCELAQEA